MNTKLRCLLLDDELPGLSYLKMLCEQIPEVEVVKAFDQPRKLLQESQKLDFDLCILDIEMPDLNGLQVANLLNGKPVIFATAYEEHAADAFDLNAIDYIRKPIKLDRLQQAIEKAVQILKKESPATGKQFVQLNTNKGKAILFFEKIAHIRTSEIDSRDKIAQLFEGEEFVLKNITFDRLLEILPPSDFCRINKREILSIKAVQVFSFDEITTNLNTDSGENIRLTLSDIYRNEFLKKIKV